MIEVDNRTKTQRWSDNIAEFCGSWGFVGWFTAIILVWILLNTYVIIFDKFDPSPFIALNLVLTVVSTMQSPIIMMSQNRQVERDRDMVRDVHSKLDQILKNTGK